MSLSKRKLDEEVEGQGNELSGLTKKQKDNDGDGGDVKKVLMKCEKIYFGKALFFRRFKVESEYLHLFIDDRIVRITGDVEVAPQNERFKLAFQTELDKIDHFKARILAPKYRALEIYVKPQDQSEDNQKMLEQYRYNLDKNGCVALRLKFNADTAEEMFTALREVLGSQTQKVEYTK